MHTHAQIFVFFGAIGSINSCLIMMNNCGAQTTLRLCYTPSMRSLWNPCCVLTVHAERFFGVMIHGIHHHSNISLLRIHFSLPINGLCLWREPTLYRFATALTSKWNWYRWIIILTAQWKNKLKKQIVHNSWLIVRYCVIIDCFLGFCFFFHQSVALIVLVLMWWIINNDWTVHSYDLIWVHFVSIVLSL